jgi:hypothetical protein
MLANKEGSSSADPPPKHRLFLPANSTARAVISQEVLQQRAADCHRRGDAFAGNITDGRIRQASGVLDNILILTILPILAPKLDSRTIASMAGPSLGRQIALGVEPDRRFKRQNTHFFLGLPGTGVGS